MIHPEFDQGYEFAGPDELQYLFDQTYAQLLQVGKHKPLRGDVARATDGLAIITEDDVNNEQTDGRFVTLATDEIIDYLPLVAKNLELEGGACLDMWYVPDHYYQQGEPGLGWSVSGHVYVPPQVAFIVPKNDTSIYGEDVIHLRRHKIGDTEIVNLERDQALRHEYYNALHVIGDGRNETVDDVAQVNCAFEDLNSLSSREVAELLLIVRFAPFAKAC